MGGGGQLCSKFKKNKAFEQLLLMVFIEQLWVLDSSDPTTGKGDWFVWVSEPQLPSQGRPVLGQERVPGFIQILHFPGEGSGFS